MTWYRGASRLAIRRPHPSTDGDGETFISIVREELQEHRRNMGVGGRTPRLGHLNLLNLPSGSLIPPWWVTDENWSIYFLGAGYDEVWEHLEFGAP